jgi:hypothetical protein
MSRLFDNVYPFRCGYLNGTIKGAIAQLETFVEIHGENMSESQHYHIRYIKDELRKGMEQAAVITPDSAKIVTSQES